MTRTFLLGFLQHTNFHVNYFAYTKRRVFDIRKVLKIEKEKKNKILFTILLQKTSRVLTLLD